MDLSYFTDGVVTNRESNRHVQRLEVAPVNRLEATQVNPKGLVISHERIHVHGHSHFRAGVAKGFGMVHQAVEVGGAEAPIAEAQTIYVPLIS